MKRRILAYLFLALASAAVVYFDSQRDPLTNLERAAMVVPEALANVPFHEPSALPDTQARLEMAARRLKVSITYAPLPHPLYYGYYALDERAIVINEKLNSDLRTWTLAHELGHALQPYGLDKGDMEVFATAVAYLVVLPEDERLSGSASYVAMYKTHAHVIRDLRQEILFAAKFLRGEE